MVTATIAVLAAAASFAAAAMPYIMLGLSIYSMVDGLTNKGKSSLNNSMYGGTGSPTYGFGPLQTQTSNLLARPIVYGKVKCAGNKIWQSGENTSTVKQLILFSDGEIYGYEDIKFNNEDYSSLSGCSVSRYYGDGVQVIDSRVSGDTEEDQAEIVGGLKYDAYLAITAQASDKITNSGFNVTAIVSGRKILYYDYYTEEEDPSLPFNILSGEIIDLEKEITLYNGRTGAKYVEYFWSPEFEYTTVYGQKFDITKLFSVWKEASEYSIKEFMVVNPNDISSLIELGEFNPSELKYIHGVSIREDNLYLTGVDASYNRKIIQYSLSNPYDLLKISPLFIREAPISYSASLYISKDRVHAFAIENSGNRTLYHYKMTTPGDISTLYQYQTKNLPTTGNSNVTSNFTFSDDGKIFICTDNNTGASPVLSQFSMETGWDIANWVEDDYASFEEYFDPSVDDFQSVVFNDEGRSFIPVINTRTAEYDEQLLHQFITGATTLSSVGYNSNPAWCIYDFLTYYNGINLSINELDLQSFYDAAAYCDVDVEGQVRFSLNLILDTKKSRHDWLSAMLLVCRGYLVYIDGKLHLKIDQAGSSEQSFTTSNIITDSEKLWTTPRENKYDIVKVQFIDPDNEWARIYAVAELTTYNNEQPIIKEVEAFGITNFKQASRLAWFYLNEATITNKFISFDTTKEGLDRTVGDLIDITLDTFGYTSKIFRITSLSEEEEGQIKIIAKEYNEILYNDTQGSITPTYTPIVEEDDEDFGQVSAGSGSYIETINSNIVEEAGLEITSVIPFDGTTPQIGEGTEILSFLYTPNNSESTIKFECVVPSIYTDAATTVSLALFKDSVCIGATSINLSQTGSTEGYSITLDKTITLSTMDLFSLSLRIGVDSAGPTIMIGNKFGPSGIPYITIIETKYIENPDYLYIEDLSGRIILETDNLLRLE